MAKNVLTHNLSEPLDGAKTVKVNLNPGNGNLTIDTVIESAPELASGTLEYLESQGVPTRSMNNSNGQAALTLKAGSSKQPWFRLPWAACNGATTWQVHLNPSISADITAHSDGGNLRIELAGMRVTHVLADTGGGNVDVLLSGHTHDLDVTAKTGAGTVTVDLGSLAGSSRVEASSGAGNVNLSLPGGTAARIHAASGMGKVIVDPCFTQVDKNTYQSQDFDRAADRVEITLKSGAGNVVIATKAAWRR